MLVDATILLYAVDESADRHSAAKAWLEEVLNGPRRVGLPWQSLSAFVRIATNARATPDPLTAREAWTLVEAWLDTPVAWIPQPTSGHRSILGELVTTLDLRGNLVSDAVLATLCLEHGLTMCSTDSDFARFPQVRWVDPLMP